MESQDDVLVKSFSVNVTKLISKQRQIPLIPTEIRWGGDLGELESGMEFQPYFSFCESEFRHIATYDFSRASSWLSKISFFALFYVDVVS